MKQPERELRRSYMKFKHNRCLLLHELYIFSSGDLIPCLLAQYNKIHQYSGIFVVLLLMTQC
uniref:Uncharacterized protein n=1 Tax=Arion vulgaris TaxID=1028688 RepID=A0A0B7B194_9EUPU